ncbi:hypothetical protein [Mucilaginibacter sp.]|uniref:hypothetical protein n=1 Tax=Mucilaginibacter sp. TaxID=1882438 RepID=UPI00260580BB|nr:hypothetical protein [Mucilaginibacter sp.]MDB4920324.1 hypothetical protein [Mucilaginibacter sp.]
MKKAAWILLLFCFACTSKPKAPVAYISSADSNRSVKFKGLDYAIVSEINRDPIPGIWENLLPVYRMPADTDLKNYQPVQHGLYILKDSAVIFTPDTPFVKGQTYFMRYYQFKGENIWDYIKGKKRLGRVGYSDLVIRF